MVNFRKTFTETRFLPFENEQKDPTTQKAGIRVHSLPVAALLKISIFRLVTGIVSIETPQGLLHLNAGSFKKWCSRYGVDNLNLTSIEKIQSVIERALKVPTTSTTSLNNSRQPKVPTTSNSSLNNSRQPVEDEQEVLDEEEPELALKKKVQTLEKDQIEYLASKDNRQQPSMLIRRPFTFEVARMQAIVQASIEAGFDGKVHIDHGFELRFLLDMGMQPYDRDENYVRVVYGGVGSTHLRKRKDLLTSLRENTVLPETADCLFRHDQPRDQCLPPSSHVRVARAARTSISRLRKKNAPFLASYLF